MLKERFLKITNLMSDDEAANTAYYTRDNFLHKLVLMTTDGIMIISFILNGELIDVKDSDCEEIKETIDNGFGVSVEADKDVFTLIFDEDGDFVNHSIPCPVSLDSVYTAGDMEELSTLVEDGDVDENIYSILDELHVMIG